MSDVFADVASDKCRRLFAVLLHGRPTGRAQIALLPLQAGDDRPDVRDLSRAQPIDIGRAGPALLRRAEGKGRRRADEREEDTDR